MTKITSSLILLLICTAIILHERADTANIYRDLLTGKSYAEQVAQLTATMHSKNAETVVSQWEAVMRTLPNEMSASAHEYAHALGEALFLTRGWEGLFLCSNYSLNGCLHQFMIQAIKIEGINAVPFMFEKCSAAKPDNDAEGNFNGDCYHALGHAIQAHAGNSTNSRDAALEICEKFFTDDDLLFGCKNGALMEYQMNHPAEQALSESSPASLYETCDSLSNEDALICALRLPKWWMQNSSSDILQEKDAQSFLSYCKKIESFLGDATPLCYASIGTLAVYASTTTLANEYCSTDTVSENYSQWCKAGAVLSYSQNTMFFKQDTADFCEEYMPQSASCKTEYTIIKNIVLKAEAEREINSNQ